MLETAFLQLLQAHTGILHKVCNLYCRNNTDRQDLLQEMMLQLWKAFPGYRGEAKPGTWMYRVVLNTAITHIRNEKKQAQVLPLPGNLILPEEDDSSQFNEQWKMLQMAIQRLTDIEKAMVVLYLEKKTYAEMEEILGVRQGALRVKMNRIKEKLRQNVHLYTH